MIGNEAKRNVRVVDHRILADGILGLRLEAADDEPFPLWSPGAHIDIVLPDEMTRQYSLCGDVNDSAGLEVAILREPLSRGGSEWIHDSVKLGDELTIRGPRNHFELESAPSYIFIAGGIGITPIRPMIAAAEAQGADWSLFYGGRSRTSMAFASDLVEAYGDRVELVPQDDRGILDLAQILGTPDDNTYIYCCGPEGLLGAVEALSTAWPAGALHVERFAPKPMEPVSASIFEVELVQSGLTLSIGPDQSILDAVEDAGLSVPSSCTEGTCGTCETAVLAGIVEHRDSILTEEERAENNTMMICVSRARSAKLQLDL